MNPFIIISTANPAGGGSLGSVPFLVIGIVIGAVVGVGLYVMLATKTLKAAKAEEERILAAAKQEAATIKEKAELDAEKRALERREQLESEMVSIRDELKDTERRLTKREDSVDRKFDALGVKEKHLDDRAKTLEADEVRIRETRSELEQVLEKQKAQLLDLAGLSPEQAKDMVLARVEDECSSEMNSLAQKMYLETEADVKTKSREVVLTAIQRYAGEYVAESTVRAVPIPSDDMKGRIIGREGRNIRAIERATGVDVMVDDTPGLISVSSFDKIRQTVAAESLQKLIEDGRIHPTRIEEVVESVREDVQERVLRKGKEAVTEVKLRGIHPKIVEAMGKLVFRTSYGQNVLQHSIEVAFLSQIIADQLGFDSTLARRCGFLHDIGKAMDHEMEGGHPKIGMEFCKKFNERDEVLNAIGGHHGDIPSTSIYTPIVMAADAISGARPGARRESMEQYVQRLEQLEQIAKENTGVSEAYAIQAGREVRIIVDADKVSDPDAFGIARRVAQKVSEEMTFPGEIKVTVLRETRAVEYAT